MLLSGFALLTVVFFLGSWLLWIPSAIFVGRFGALGWIPALLAVALVVGLVSYHGYRRTLGAHLDDAYEITPENTPELAELFEFLERESAAREMDVPAVYVHPASVVNAFAIGRRQNGRIVLTDGALATFDEAELRAIVGHELAHLDNRDTVVMTVTCGLRRLIVSFWTWVGYVGRLAVYQHRNVALTPAEKTAVKHNVRRRVKYVSSPISFFQKSLSRHREYVADADAAAMTDPADVVSALESMHEFDDDAFDYKVSSSLCIFGKTSGFLSRFRSTHPPTEKRIARVRELYD